MSQYNSPDKCVVSKLSKVDDDTDSKRRQSVLKRLYMATILCSCFLVVEAVGGYLAGSLAVMSDAAHLFSDLASFAVAIGASYLASLPPSETHTYGLKRSESLAALFSMLSLAFVSIILAYEAIQRLLSPPEAGVDGMLMSGIAAIGVLVNIALAFVLGVENHVHLPGGCEGGHDHNHDHGHGHDSHEGVTTTSTKHDNATGCSGHDHDSHGHDHHQSDATTGNSHDHGHSHAHQEETTTHKSHGHDHHHTDHDEEQGCDHSSSHHHGHDKEDHEEGHGHSHAHETDALLGAKSSATSKPSPCDGHHHGHGHGHGHGHQQEKIHAHEQSSSSTKSCGDHDNVNLRAAYLHVLGDLLQSVAVLIAGIVIYLKPEWHIVDPIVTLIFCMFIFHSTIGVIRTSIAVLLEESPPNISWQKVYDSISRIECVTNVHHLHIWSISHGEPALSVHCNCVIPMVQDPTSVVTTTTCIDTIYKQVNKEFGFTHVTIQVQSEDGPCVTCRACRYGETKTTTSDHHVGTDEAYTFRELTN